MPVNHLQKATVSRLNTLLNSLAEQASLIDQYNTQQQSHWLIENNNLFSPQLFKSDSDKYSHYVIEVKTGLTEFQRLSSKITSEPHHEILAKTKLLHIEQQIMAIVNALKANDAMHLAAERSYNAYKEYKNKKMRNKQSQYQDIANNFMASSHQLYQKLSEHHEFERRLLDMINEREIKRQKSKQSETASQLSNEVLALHQRLGRCRKAITAIEKEIEFAERKT